MRALADTMNNIETIAIMLRLAEDYDRLSERAATRSNGGVPVISKAPTFRRRGGTMAPHGVYREHKDWSNQDSARVRYDDGKELDIPEDRYRLEEYQPQFDDLPWKGEIRIP
jgi:hypothetical protein